MNLSSSSSHMRCLAGRRHGVLHLRPSPAGLSHARQGSLLHPPTPAAPRAAFLAAVQNSRRVAARAAADSNGSENPPADKDVKPGVNGNKITDHAAGKVGCPDIL